MPIFNFALRPLADIQPLRGPSGATLSWFSLTDGWFWLALGGQEILRSEGEPTEGELPYLDHQVARLWEDLIVILPAVLSEIPGDVAEKLAKPKEWRQLVERLALLDDEQPRLAAALGFWWERQLANHYVVKAPRVHFWRSGETVHAAWSTPQNDLAWTRVEGHVSMPLADFLREVRAFDAAFLTLMGERVGEIERSGGVPDSPPVAVDLKRLAQEQSERGRWLELALQARSPPVDWAEVRWMLGRGLPQ